MAIRLAVEAGGTPAVRGGEALRLSGVLAALLLVLVRTVAMFELTFLTSGPTSQTLVVALYYAVFASGARAGQEVDAMAVVYMVTTLAWLLLSRFSRTCSHLRD